MKFLLLSLSMLTTFVASAQQWVSTNPETKRALFEQFTGVQCAGCPAGAEEIDTLLHKYPDKLYAVEYHHPNTLFCVPYGNDPDFRRSFLAAFANTAFNFIGAYPTSFISRRMWPGETHRNFVITHWEQRMNTIKTEPSPLNIGLHPVYDPVSKTLTVDVEVYYTAAVTDPLTLYVEFSENGLIAIQKNGINYDSNYVHNRVFRESLCAQWGDPLLNTSQGTLYTTTYNFSNVQNLYNMSNCQVLVFVRNASNEEIITVNGAAVIVLPMTIDKNQMYDFSVFPNPADKNVIVEGLSEKAFTQLFDNDMQLVGLNSKFVDGNTIIDCETLQNGIYFLVINEDGKKRTKKLMVCH